MVSTASTVIEFWTPDTVRLAQWPVITTLLEMPLTATTLSLQAIVRFSLMPETLRLAPAGAVGADVGNAEDGGAAALRETLGVGDRMTKPLWECRCALYDTRATTPITKNGAKSHKRRKPEGDLRDGPGNVPS